MQGRTLKWWGAGSGQSIPNNVLGGYGISQKPFKFISQLQRMHNDISFFLILSLEHKLAKPKYSTTACFPLHGCLYRKFWARMVSRLRSSIAGGGAFPRNIPFSGGDPSSCLAAIGCNGSHLAAQDWIAQCEKWLWVPSWIWVSDWWNLSLIWE